MSDIGATETALDGVEAVTWEPFDEGRGDRRDIFDTIGENPVIEDPDSTSPSDEYRGFSSIAD